MGDSDIHLRILWIAAITILPLIPSVILFRALNSIGEVEGPLHGFKLKLGGAFAGYFALFIGLWTYAGSYAPSPTRGDGYRAWRVTGSVVYDAHGHGSPWPPNITWSLRPPDAQVGHDGSFSFEVPVREEGGEPVMTTLTALSEGLVPATIHLLKSPDFGVPKLGQVIDEANRTIHFTDPIVLTPTGDAPAYAFSVHSPVEVATLHENSSD